MMNEFEKHLLSEVIDSVEAHPLSAIFADPITPDGGVDPEYFRVIRRPMDLESLQTNLRNGRYASQEEFDRDAELIWANAERFYGKQSFLGVAAGEMRKRFRKCARKVMVKTVNGFCEEVMRLRAKIGDQIATETITAVNPEIAMLRKEWNGMCPKLIGEGEMQSFLNAFEMLTDEKDVQRVSEIVREKQPELLDNSEVVPMTMLLPTTFEALKSYLREALGKRGLEYLE